MENINSLDLQEKVLILIHLYVSNKVMYYIIDFNIFECCLRYIEELIYVQVINEKFVCVASQIYNMKMRETSYLKDMSIPLTA